MFRRKEGTYQISVFLLCLLFLFVCSAGWADITVTEEEAASVEKDAGVIGGFFHFIGEVIAFPFRVVGGALDAVF